MIVLYVWLWREKEREKEFEKCCIPVTYICDLCIRHKYLLRMNSCLKQLNVNGTLGFHCEQNLLYDIIIGWMKDVKEGNQYYQMYSMWTSLSTFFILFIWSICNESLLKGVVYPLWLLTFGDRLHTSSVQVCYRTCWFVCYQSLTWWKSSLNNISLWYTLPPFISFVTHWNGSKNTT